MLTSVVIMVMERHMSMTKGPAVPAPQEGAEAADAATAPLEEAIADLRQRLRQARCPTCSGPTRETVGMVCQTCGTDHGPPAEPAPELPCCGAEFTDGGGRGGRRCGRPVGHDGGHALIEPAPVPAGDGPGWDRGTIEELIAASCADATEGELNQLRALIADRDRLLAERDRKARWVQHERDIADRRQAERDAARAERDTFIVQRDALAAEAAGLRALLAERDRWERLCNAAEPERRAAWMAAAGAGKERGAARAELAEVTAQLRKEAADRDRLSGELAEVTAERDRGWEAAGDMEARERHAAADALDWVAGQAAAGQLGAWDDVVSTISLRQLAAEVRSGQRTIPAAGPRETDDRRCPNRADVTTYGDQRRTYQCCCRPDDGDHGQWTEPRETPAGGER